MKFAFKGADWDSLNSDSRENTFNTIVNHNVWHAHKLHIKRLIRSFHKQTGEQKEMVTISKPDFNNIEKAS